MAQQAERILHKTVHSCRISIYIGNLTKTLQELGLMIPSKGSSKLIHLPAPWLVQHQPIQHVPFLRVKTGPNHHAWYQAARQQPSVPAQVTDRKKLGLGHFQGLDRVLILPFLFSSWTCQLRSENNSVDTCDQQHLGKVNEIITHRTED